MLAIRLNWRAVTCPRTLPIVLVDDGTSIASSLAASGSIATRYSGYSTAAYDRSGNIILVGRGSKCSVTEVGIS